MEDFEENEQMELDRTDDMTTTEDCTDSGCSFSTDNGDELFAGDVTQGPEVEPEANYHWRDCREIIRPRKLSLDITDSTSRGYFLPPQQQPMTTVSAFNPFSIGHKGTLEMPIFDGRIAPAATLPRVKPKSTAKRNSKGLIIFEDDWGPPANWTGPDPLDPSFGDLAPQEKRKKSLSGDTDDD